ncbi:centromere-associated protein E isoform X7 [Labeo rohita]|uniref:centromere-associated protein E isoform X7 n=1 Tax=Labeo rohita TaxID=84645 RepID=UPI0021E22488|nr:centromere-associated protein E isoform X7 [Labeo rohita]
MGSQGPGRKRTPSKNGLTAEEDALNVIAKEAEARLAAKRAARAEAREIRMRELERQQKEIYQVQKKYYGLDNLDNKWGDIEQWMEDSERYTRVSRRHASASDDEERMSVGSRSNIRLDLDAAGAYGGLPQSSSYQSHKKSKKKKKHSSKTSNGCDDDLSTLSSRSSRLSDDSKMSRSSKLDRQSGSIYEDGLYSGSRRSSARASSEYSGFLGSSSRTSSRANSACGSPVEDCSSSVASFMRSTASISGLSRDLDRVVIPDLPNVNGRLSMADDRLERDYLEKGSSRASTISGSTLTSLGGTSSRRGSGDTSISADTEASIREIKEIHELKDQIQDVEAKHMQNLKELKDSLLEVEEKYRKAMVSNAQLDNEKTNMMYEVDTLKDSLMELEEMLFETRRELEEKCKDLEREKYAHSILQFQFNELKETLKQSEELLTEIRQLRLKQDGYVREISDLQETIEWKNKKIGALERQKEFSDAIRNERDELRDEVVQLKDVLKKHGIVLGPDLTTNGETGEEVGKADENSQTASAEIREGSSVLGTHQLKECKDQQQKDLDDGVPENQQISQAQISSTNTPLEAHENRNLEDQVNHGVEELENKSEEPSSSVGDDELTATRPTEEIKSEEHTPEESKDNTVELECNVHKDEHLEMDQQESECVKPSQVTKDETPLKSVSGLVRDETDKPDDMVDDKLKEEPIESSETEKPAKTQGASASNKKKKKKKKNKHKHKQCDKQESDTKIDDKNETICSEDNLNQKTEGDLEVHHQEPLENDITETTVNTDVPHDDKSTIELNIIDTSTNINADDVQDKILLVTDEVPSKTILTSDCPASSNDVLSGDLSSSIISNPANIIDEHTEDSTNPDSEAVIFSCGLVSSETETSLPHEPSAQSVDAVEVGVEFMSSSENVEKSSSVDIKEVKSHLSCEVEEQEEKLKNTDLDGTTDPEDQDDSAHPSFPAMENVESEAERVIQEQPIDQPMESQLQEDIGAEFNQKEVESQDELDKENFEVPAEKAFDTQDSTGAELDQEEVERLDELDKENLKVPTETEFDTQDSTGAELDQEEVERLDELDKENLKVPTETEFDTQDSTGAELGQEEVDTQDELEKENLKVPTETEFDTQDSTGAELGQEEVETQDERDKENHKVPTEKVVNTQDSIGAEMDQEEGERLDELDKENLKVPTETEFDTQDSTGAELGQEEVERLDELDKENLKVPTETEFDSQDRIGAELDQEEVDTQDELEKENLKVPTEKVFDGGHVDNTSLIETQGQVVLEEHLPPSEAIQELVGESEASDQEAKVEKDEEERSIQNQVTPEVQLPQGEEDLLVKSDVAAQELKEEDEEDEDEGESFDFDETDLEASSDAPLKNVLDQPNEEVGNVQEASHEYQSNVTDEDQTQENEHLEISDQESKPKEQKDDGQDTEKPQITTDVAGCVTEDSQINKVVRPNDQQHDTSGNKVDACEEHHQASEGVNLISEMEKRDAGQEINSSIHHERKTSNISGGQEVEKETAQSNKEDERKESKKSGKGKGKGKGKEDCKMS